MTAEEKAKSLLEQFINVSYEYQPYAGARYESDIIGWEAGKKCAIICCDEIIRYIIDETPEYPHYWKKVKSEIEKL